MSVRLLCQVEDLDGQLLYRVLDLQPIASQQDVKQVPRLSKAVTVV